MSEDFALALLIGLFMLIGSLILIILYDIWR